jgi:hypothetical protein
MKGSTMNEREKLWQLLNRCNDLGNRVTADVARRIRNREGLDKLDQLMTLAERATRLFWRINRRYEAAKGVINVVTRSGHYL